MILAPGQRGSNSDQPVFSISQVPPARRPGRPQINQPRVYFGLSNPNGGDVDYVLGRHPPARDRLPAVHSGANPVTEHLQGHRGRASSATSSSRRPSPSASATSTCSSPTCVTSQSRLMFVRDITQMAQKAAPFLSYDSDPYPVLADGQIYWVLDAYTTTDNYPYSQNVNTPSLPPNSGLNQNFNYVRNSVKVVVNAYSGQMTFYDVTALDQDEGPHPPDVGEGLPRHVHPCVADAADPAGPPPLPRGPAHGAVGHLRPLPHHPAARLLQRHQRLERLAERRRRIAATRPCPRRFTTNAQGIAIGPARCSGCHRSTSSSRCPGQTTQSFNLVDAFVPVSTG